MTGAHQSIRHHMCPVCRGSVVRQSRRTGLIENFILRILIMRPYVCLDCYKRFYGYSGEALKERCRTIVRTTVRSFAGRWRNIVATPQQ
jgi:hypothetical protein